MSAARREGIIYVNRHSIRDLLEGRLRFSNLPADAVIRRCFYSYEGDDIALVVSSASFEPVPDGERAPSLRCHSDGTVVRIVLEHSRLSWWLRLKHWLQGGAA